MTKGSNAFDSQLVLDQLRYLGMLEIIRIRKMGFPVHFPFDEFVSRYKCVLPHRTVLPRDYKSAARALMETQGLPRREWQVGKAKIFLRACVHEPIEDKRMHTLNQKATVIQKRWKGKTVVALSLFATKISNPTCVLQVLSSGGSTWQYRRQLG